MVLNGPFAEGTGITHPKLNTTGIIAYTGAEIAALSASAVDGQVVYCYSTGSGFFQGIWYGWNDIVGTWDALNGVPSAYDFMIGKAQVGLIDKGTAVKENWFSANSGTSSGVQNAVTSNEMRIEMTTGTTTTGWAELKTGGPLMDFSKPAMFQVKFKTPTTISGQIVKIGMGIERAGSGAYNGRNFGIEYCDASANWQIHSGTGSANSNTDTLKAVTANTLYGFMVEYLPGDKIRVTFDDATVKEKNTDIPSSGANQEDFLAHISISNNNGSSSTRTLPFMNFFGVYSILDPDWIG